MLALGLRRDNVRRVPWHLRAQSSQIPRDEQIFGEEHLNYTDYGTLEHEKAVHQGIGKFHGIAQCFEMIRKIILLDYLECGDLETYLEQNSESEGTLRSTMDSFDSQDSPAFPPVPDPDRRHCCSS